MRRFTCLFALITLIVFISGAGRSAYAAIFVGTVHYTHFTGGGPNVLKVGFTYSDTTGTLTYGAITPVATLAGADGILFAPNGNLLVTSNTVPSVYRLNATSGALLQTVATGGTTDFHMAIDPSGTKLYSSDRYTRLTGPLDTFAISPTGVLSPATTSGITGGDTDVTQLAFDPLSGNVMYTNGGPNAFGSVGLFTFGGTNTTAQLIAPGVVPAAHGIIYDPLTTQMTMFGGGEVATLNAHAGSSALITASLKEFDVPGVGDFDQGAVDGFGHAFIAGDGKITFIDYSTTGDITSPLNTIIIRTDDGLGTGFGAIDDIAPLVGLGGSSGVPEPSSLAVFGILFALFSVYAARSTKERNKQLA